MTLFLLPAACASSAPALRRPISPRRSIGSALGVTARPRTLDDALRHLKENQQ